MFHNVDKLSSPLLLATPAVVIAGIVAAEFVSISILVEGKMQQLEAMFLWALFVLLLHQAYQDVAQALPHMVLEVINNDEDAVKDIGTLYMSFDSSTIQNVKHDDSIGNNTLASNSSISCSLNILTKENTSTGNVEGETVYTLAESCNS
ncbi:hypothetical protein RYX36_005157 [Vicia faba]